MDTFALLSFADTMCDWRKFGRSLQRSQGGPHIASTRPPRVNCVADLYGRARGGIIRSRGLTSVDGRR